MQHDLIKRKRPSTSINDQSNQQGDSNFSVVSAARLSSEEYARRRDLLFDLIVSRT